MASVAFAETLETKFVGNENIKIKLTTKIVGH